jgi:hypothetical protein
MLHIKQACLLSVAGALLNNLLLLVQLRYSYACLPQLRQAHQQLQFKGDTSSRDFVQTPY